MIRRVKGISYSTGRTKSNKDPNTIRSFKIDVVPTKRSRYKSSKKRYVSETEEVIKGWLGGIFILLPLTAFLIYCFPKLFLAVLLIILFVFVVVRVGRNTGSENKEKVDQKKNYIKLQGKDFNNEIIHYVQMNNIEAVKKLLESRGYGGNFISSTGETALKISILNRNKYMLAYLIKYGAFPLPIDLKVAMESKDPEIIEMIKTGHHQKTIKLYELLNKKSI